jgi:hypothetical protein
MPEADPIVKAVQADLDARSVKGIKKYGTTVAGNPGDLRYWLQHAYEEGLDQLLYLKRAMQEIDDPAHAERDINPARAAAYADLDKAIEKHS